MGEKICQINNFVTNSSAAVDLVCSAFVAPKWNVLQWEMVFRIVFNETLESCAFHV